MAARTQLVNTFKTSYHIFQKFGAMAPVAIDSPLTRINSKEQAWSKTASGYASNVGRYSALLSGRLVELASTLRPIDSTSAALDVAAGTGAVSLAFAHQNPESNILATDISPKMLSVIDSYQLPNVSTQIANALELGGSVDKKFSHAFLSFMLQITRTPEKVLEGIKERLEPHGIMGLTIWGQRIDPYEIWQEACQSIDPTYKTMEDFDDPHAWRTGEDLKSHFEKAGFEDVITEDITTSFDFPNTDAFMDFWFNSANPAALLVIRQWKGDFELARAATRKVCEERYDDGRGIKLEAVLGVGRKST